MKTSDYQLDLDAIMSWVSKTPKSEQAIHRTIIETYDDKGHQLGKELTEDQTALNDTMNNLRYDMIKSMIATICASENTMSYEDMTFGQRLIFDTLVIQGIIVANDDE